MNQKIKLLWMSILCMTSLALIAQQNIEGIVFEDLNGERFTVEGVNIFTEDGEHGTTSKSDGFFKLELPSKYKELIISHIGFKTKYLKIDEFQKVGYILLEPTVMQEVEVSYRKLDRSFVDPQNVQMLGAADLKKAACCNLSESFDTNMGVNVGYSDAVTGSKKISMLGLEGRYTQILFENMPSLRGLANTYGLMYVPGPFISDIAINRGAGSVVNGYESMTGQIDYGYKMPCSGERFFLNLFGTRHGMFELNTIVNQQFNEKLSTSLMLHGSLQRFNHDANQNSFLDMPINERINVMNRWKYESESGFELQAGINYVFDERESGQFISKKHNLGLNESDRLYNADVVNRKYDFFAKTSYFFKKVDGQNLGIQYRFTHHSTNGWFGGDTYRGVEDFANINMIFATPITEFQSIKLGASYFYNHIRESYRDIDLDRRENVPGIFAEYTYQDNEKLAIIAGTRFDMHNLYGAWFSPRVNFKYNIQPDFVVKLSGGKGYRTPNIFADNFAVLASSRQFNVLEDVTYESAWNFGIGLFKEVFIGQKSTTFAVDYFRTDFTNQLIADFENPREVNYYNLDGKSYSNSFQIEGTIELFEGVDFALAYKLDDVKMNFNSGLKAAPYVPRHRLLATIDLESKNERWRFNVNAHYNGVSRLPSTASNLEIYQRPQQSEAFVIINTQITHVVKKWEFYVGAENITNYWQQNPIIANDDPFGSFFDASIIWGPLAGTRAYFGFRYSLPYNKKS